MMIQGNLDLHSLSDKKPVWHLASEFGRTQVLGLTRRSTTVAGSSRECAHCMILLSIMCESCRRDSGWRAELDVKYIIVTASSAG